MVFPLVPILLIGGGVVAGAVLSGDNSEAQVIVNTQPTAGASIVSGISNAALLGGTALAAVLIGPKIIREFRK